MYILKYILSEIFDYLEELESSSVHYYDTCRITHCQGWNTIDIALETAYHRNYYLDFG